jgi:hypothetical protein
MTKQVLFQFGVTRINTWCVANSIKAPYVYANWQGNCDFGVCAYYRKGTISIWPNQCAAIGTAGRQWSFPGYCVDRTPFGVLAHELGHHVDCAHGAAGGTLSHIWRPIDPVPLTSYCLNDNEWFAELFRLFVTNPDLLRVVRPRIWSLFDHSWISVETRDWQTVLASAPRQLAAARNRIARAT